MGPQGPQGEPGSAAPAITAWPVGSIFIAVVPTNPATLLGGGTWVEFGKGRMLLATDSATPSIDDAEVTGGSWTKTLTEANLASHDHTINHDHANAVTDTEAAHTHAPGNPQGTHFMQFSTAAGYARTAGTGMVVNATTGSAGAHSHAVDIPTFNGNSGAAGSNTPVDITPPYITTFMWKRTA